MRKYENSQRAKSNIQFIFDDALNSYLYLDKFNDCGVIAGLIHPPNGRLSKVFEQISKVLYDGFLFVSVKDGNGKNLKSSSTTINGEDYDRDFYLHILEELKLYSLGKFDLVKELLIAMLTLVVLLIKNNSPNGK